MARNRHHQENELREEGHGQVQPRIVVLALLATSDRVSDCSGYANSEGAGLLIGGNAA